jgi:hypothetical protein
MNGTANGTAAMAGKPTQRKQLSEQLDRLDTIIDALAEGLPGAVTDAVREGARAAVKDAIIEILTNPELRAVLAHTVPATPQSTPPAPVEPPPLPPKPERPSLWSRIKSKVSAAKAAIIGAVGSVKDAVVGRYRAARAAIHTVALASGEPAPVRQISVTALAVGVVVGFVCLTLPETVAAAVGGVSAATTAVCVQMGSWLRRVACRVGLLA